MAKLTKVKRGGGGQHSPRKAEGLVRSDSKWCREPVDLHAFGHSDFQIKANAPCPKVAPAGALKTATDDAEDHLKEFAKDYCDEGTCRVSSDLCVPVIGELKKTPRTWKPNPRQFVNGSEICNLTVRVDATVKCRCSSTI